MQDVNFVQKLQHLHPANDVLSKVEPLMSWADRLSLLPESGKLRVRTEKKD